MTGITYEEALSTLTSMFGDPWTQDQLDQILRHFQGHMENTVDAILCHGDGDPDILVARLQNPSDVSMDEQIARQLQSEDSQNRPTGTVRQPKLSSISPFPGSSSGRKHNSSYQATPAPTPMKKGIGTPTDLPPDFLRIPGRKYDTMSEDEALARMLQDEMFTAQIANNPEFAHLARGRNSNRPVTASNAGDLPQGPNIIDQLAEMGNNAKRKLSLLAAQWNANNQPHSGNDEARSLLDDRENDEFFGFTGGNRSNEMEMSSIPSTSYDSKKDK